MKNYIFIWIFESKIKVCFACIGFKGIIRSMCLQLQIIEKKEIKLSAKFK